MENCVFKNDENCKNNDNCKLLYRDHCIGCTFAKTKEELDEGRAKSQERIANLPEDKCIHILRKYYKGKMRETVAKW